MNDSAPSRSESPCRLRVKMSELISEPRQTRGARTAAEGALRGPLHELHLSSSSCLTARERVPPRVHEFASNHRRVSTLTTNYLYPARKVMRMCGRRSRDSKRGPYPVTISGLPPTPIDRPSTTFPSCLTGRRCWPLVDPPARAHPTSATVVDAHRSGLVSASPLEPRPPLFNPGRLRGALFALLRLIALLLAPRFAFRTGPLSDPPLVSIHSYPLASYHTFGLWYPRHTKSS